MKITKIALCLLLALLLAAAPLCAFAETIYLGKAKNDCTVYDKSQKAIGTLPKGEYVIAVATSDSRVLKIMTTTGATGYAMTSKLSCKASADSSTLGTIRKNTTVYGIKDAQPYVVGVIPAGSPVIIDSVISGYAKIRSLHGLSGYVKTGTIKHL